MELSMKYQDLLILRKVMDWSEAGLKRNKKLLKEMRIKSKQDCQRSMTCFVY